MALNLVAQLQRLGLGHYILFGDNAQLVEHVRRHRAAAMVWSSLLERFTQPLGPDPRCPRSCGDAPSDSFAQQRASVLPWVASPRNTSQGAVACREAQRAHCLPSAATFYRCDSVRRLWLLRHHYTARLLGMGHRVLMLDSDSLVLADPYPLIRAHLGAYAALCLHDISARPAMAVNGGTWYVRGAPDGPVQRLFEAAYARAVSVLEAYPASERETLGKLGFGMQMRAAEVDAATTAQWWWANGGEAVAAASASASARAGKAGRAGRGRGRGQRRGRGGGGGGGGGARGRWSERPGRRLLSRAGGGRGGDGKGGGGGGGKRGGGARPPRPASRSFLLFDQTILNAALLSALLGRDAWPVAAEDEEPALSAAEREAVRWRTTCCVDAPASLAHPPLPGGIDGGAAGVRDVHTSTTSWWDGGGGAPGAPGRRRSQQETQYGRQTSIRYVELHDTRPCARPLSGGGGGGGGGSYYGGNGGPGGNGGHAGGRNGGDGGGDHRLLGGLPRGRRRCARLPAERVGKAPPWLFSAESDVSPATGRTAATMWGAVPPPAAVVHFVCSSWPGSDGRRAAMALWGHWHAARIDGALGAPHQATQRARRRALLALAAPLSVDTPAAMGPFLRLLTLLARLSGHTPVLPLTRCTAPPPPPPPSSSAGTQAPAAQPVQPVQAGPAARRTGWVASRDVPRPCGWVVHHVGGVALSPPLCVQRPSEGCFTAMATPTDTAAALGAPYWRRLNDGANASEAAAAAGQAEGASVRRLGLAAALSRGGGGGGGGGGGSAGTCGGERGGGSGKCAPADGATRLLRLAERIRQGLDRRAAAAASDGGAAAPHVTLLSLTAADEAAVAQLPELRSGAAFDRFFRAATRRARPLDAGLQRAWGSCVTMVLHGKCSAVC